MQETLLDELSTTRRVRLHGQVGEALEKRWAGSAAAERASRLAQHFVEAATLTPRHAEKAVRYSKLAAEQAEAQTAWERGCPPLRAVPDPCDGQQGPCEWPRAGGRGRSGAARCPWPLPPQRPREPRRMARLHACDHALQGSRGRSRRGARDHRGARYPNHSREAGGSRGRGAESREGQGCLLGSTSADGLAVLGRTRRRKHRARPQTRRGERVRGLAAVAPLACGVAGAEGVAV